MRGSVALPLQRQCFQQPLLHVIIHAAVMPQAYVVMKPFFVEPLEHVINGLVGEGGQQNALSLPAEAFDDLSYDAGFAGTWRSMDEQVVLHLHSALDGAVLLGIEVCSGRSREPAESRTLLARYQSSHVRSCLQPAQEILDGAQVNNVGSIAIDQGGMGDEFGRPYCDLLGADADDGSCHDLD